MPQCLKAPATTWRLDNIITCRHTNDVTISCSPAPLQRLDNSMAYRWSTQCSTIKELCNNLSAQ